MVPNPFSEIDSPSVNTLICYHATQFFDGIVVGTCEQGFKREVKGNNRRNKLYTLNVTSK